MGGCGCVLFFLALMKHYVLSLLSKKTSAVAKFADAGRIRYVYERADTIVQTLYYFLAEGIHLFGG